MKKIVVFALTLLGLGLYSCTKDNPTPVSQNPTINPKLTSQELEDLRFLREEEKLARDVYLYSFEKYGLQIFDKISSSE